MLGQRRYRNAISQHNFDCLALMLTLAPQTAFGQHTPESINGRVSDTEGTTQLYRAVQWRDPCISPSLLSLSGLLFRPVQFLDSL